MPYDRLERLTDLLLVLLDARRPMPLDEIALEVPGYPEAQGARRQAFERDKRLLREEGIPLLTEPVEGPEQFGYRIDPDRYYLPDLDLDREERSALHLAVAGVHLGNLSGRGALHKLGAAGVDDANPLASMVAPPHLHNVWEALRTRSRVTFEYRGTTRDVSPGGLWFRRGHWYLVGWDHGPEAQRTFRVDRLQGPPVLGEPGSAAFPEGLDPSSGVPGEPWQVGEGDERQALLDVDAVVAPRVVEEVGERSVVSREAGGAVRIRLPVTNFTALRSWLLALLDHAELVEPQDWRDDLTDWLRSTASAGPHPSEPEPEPEPAPPEPAPPKAGEPPAPTLAAARSRPDTAQRLRRLLAMVGWLAQVGEADISEVSSRFEIEPDEVVRELELAACCGLPPYTPDVLMEIVITGDRVRAALPEDLARPRRLTPAEALSIVASARTILAIPGADQSGALAGALEKLERALGHQRVSVDLDEPALLEDVRRAVDQGLRAEISYHSVSSDRTGRRVIDPARLSAIEGRWYLDAVDLGVGSFRRFRVDRIDEFRPTGEQVDAERLGRLEASGDGTGASGSGVAPGPAFVPGPDAVRVRLRLEGAAAWVLDSVPVDEVRPMPGEAFDVTLYAGNTAWLERLLLQVGPEGSLVAPAELADVGPEAARRLLERYRPREGAERVGGPE
jgi:predicted DNA-binding transcriptional regulator YafY